MALGRLLRDKDTLPRLEAAAAGLTPASAAALQTSLARPGLSPAAVRSPVPRTPSHFPQHTQWHAPPHAAGIGKT